MNREAFENVVRVMRTASIKVKYFDMEQWFGGYLHADDHVKEVPCGTSACAIGYCVPDPYFVNKGLTIGIPPGLNYSKEPIFYNGPATIYGFDALEAFFDVSEAVVITLFTDSGYVDEERDLDDDPITPEEVAEKIEHMLATGIVHNKRIDEAYTV